MRRFGEIKLSDQKYMTFEIEFKLAEIRVMKHEVNFDKLDCIGNYKEPIYTNLVNISAVIEKRAERLFMMLKTMCIVKFTKHFNELK